MKKDKCLRPAMMILVVLLVTIFGMAGCARNNGGGQNTSAPAVTTGNGQTASQQPAQTSGQQPAQSGQQQPPANGKPAGNSGSQQMQVSMKNALAALVSKGTITQAQADAVVQAMTSGGPGQGQGGQQGQGPLAQLVANGTLTQSQADAVMQALPQPANGPGGPGQTNNQ